MSIEGVIQDVLETHPLQLKVTVDGATRHVALRTDTEVRSAAASSDPNRLRPGQRVRIEVAGTEAGAGSASALVIDILEEAPEPAAPPLAEAAESGGEPEPAADDLPLMFEFRSSEPSAPLAPEEDDEGSS